MHHLQRFLRAVCLTALLIILSACNTQSSARITPLPTLPPNITRTPTLTPPPLSTLAAATLAAQLPTRAATATPLDNQLPFGSARAMALATDTALKPTPRSPITFEQFPVAIKFDEFYSGYSIRQGLLLSDKLVSLDGERVIIEGYMAPPLKPELDYFVLTRIQLSFCPFCSTAADWPDDIALVYMPDDAPVQATDRPIRLYGTLEVGMNMDAETGMFSLVRIYAERMEIIN
jgi:hypothetical protein